MRLGPLLLPTVKTVRDRLRSRPCVAVVLGSGLGQDVEHDWPVTKVMAYHDIPQFPGTKKAGTVAGHDSVLYELKLRKASALIFAGRFHLYEGFTPREVVAPVRLAHALGCSHLVVTNAAGGLAQDLAAGDLMVITDHINHSGTSPLMGPIDENLGPRFPDMTRAYDPTLIGLFTKVTSRQGPRPRLKLKKGVYLGVHGPAYETPAEVRAYQSWGAAAVGMSTVLEVEMAAFLGLKAAGLAIIANSAQTARSHPLTHEEVLHRVMQAKKKAMPLLEAWLHEVEQGLLL